MTQPEENKSGAAAEDSEKQITFTVKSSSDAKYVLTLPSQTTIADLKQKLSSEDYASIPVERQRLIYSGRVLKDPDTLGGCKIKDGHSVHLVRGAESNQRQNPANQGGAAAASGAGNPAARVPTNFAAGTRASDPLDQLTGARLAGFHGLPSRDAFGPDGGLGPRPDPEHFARMLDDPNFLQQMNETMNNPMVLEMIRNSPEFRNNPMMQAMLENPEIRRQMFNPEMMRAQLAAERAMGGRGAGANSFPMPGETDTTPPSDTTASAHTGSDANATAGTGAPANPFARLFPGAGGNNNNSNNNANARANPFASMLEDPAVQNMARQMMQNPQLMQQMMQADPNVQSMMQNPEQMQQRMQQILGNNSGQGEGGFNPFGNLFGGSAEPPAPADNRPPEVRYEEQLRQLNDMGFYEFERNVQALRRSGGSVQGAVEYLVSNLS